MKKKYFTEEARIEAQKRYQREYKARKRQKDKFYYLRYENARHKKTENAINRFCKWSIQDDILVLQHDIPDTQLCIKIGRSESAVRMRRYVLIRRGNTVESLKIRMNALGEV